MQPFATAVRPLLVLLLSAIPLSCTKTAATPTPCPPTAAPETEPSAPMLRGVYSEAQPSEETLLHELYVVFDGEQLRVGHRMLGEPDAETLPTAAKLCEVYFDTTLEWTPTGFNVANGISTQSKVGVVSVFLENEEATSGSFSFDGSSCEVQLVPGAYTVETTAEVGEDGRPVAFVLTPPAGAPQRFSAAQPASFQDLGQALWDALQPAP